MCACLPSVNSVAMEAVGMRGEGVHVCQVLHSHFTWVRLIPQKFSTILFENQCISGHYPVQSGHSDPQKKFQPHAVCSREHHHEQPCCSYPKMISLEKLKRIVLKGV